MKQTGTIVTAVQVRPHSATIPETCSTSSPQQSSATINVTESSLSSLTGTTGLRATSKETNMLTKSLLTGFLSLTMAAELSADQNFVPPPPAVGTSIPLSAPERIANPPIVPPSPVQAIPAESTLSPYALPQSAPAGQIPTTQIFPAEASEYTTPANSPYLFQPAPGTFPYSQSQYNTFSTTGYPVAPMSFSPSVGMHDRYPYYSYRRPWYSPGPASRNVNIIW